MPKPPAPPIAGLGVDASTSDNGTLRRLADVCESEIEIRDPRREPSRPFAYIDISSINTVTKQIESPKLILGIEAPSRARQVIRADDVLVATTRPNLNAVARVPNEFEGEVCSTGFCVLRAGPELDPRYLIMFVRSSGFVWSISQMVKGALYPAVTERQVLEQLIPVPALPVQRRIADRLEGQLRHVEDARAAAETQARTLTALREAVRGEVFGAARVYSVRSLGSLADSEDAFADGPFGSNLKTEHYRPVGARVVRLQNIGKGEFLDRDKAYVSEEHYLGLRRHAVRPADLVVAALGDGARPAGRACLIPDGLGRGIVKADCFRVRLPLQSVDPRFLMHWLNSPQHLGEVSRQMRGATRPRFTLRMLRETQVPLPPVDVQQRISNDADCRLAASDSGRTASELAARALTDLPGALLTRAFRGEL